MKMYTPRTGRASKTCHRWTKRTLLLLQLRLWILFFTPLTILSRQSETKIKRNFRVSIKTGIPSSLLRKRETCVTSITVPQLSNLVAWLLMWGSRPLQINLILAGLPSTVRTRQWFKPSNPHLKLFSTAQVPSLSTFRPIMPVLASNIPLEPN